MELIRVACIIVWCSTIVRSTFAEKDLSKEPCLNKKCTKVSDPFDNTERDLTIERRSPIFAQKSGDLFNEIKNTADVKKVTEVHDNGFYSALCWVEITTIKEFRNGSNSAIREYAISFESPSDIPRRYLSNEGKKGAEVVTYKIFDEDTKKSEVVHFTTIHKNGNDTVRQNKKIMCGSGPIYSKEYIQWLNSNKKKIILKVSPKKQNLVASECEDDQQNSDSRSTESHVTLRDDHLSDPPQHKETVEKVRLENGVLPKSKHMHGDPDNVDSTMLSQTKFVPNDETTAIIARLGTENISPDGKTEDIVFKMKSGLESVTDKMDSSSSQSQIENYSISTENFLTSTEGTTVNGGEYSSFSTSKNLTTKPQTVTTTETVTKTFDEQSHEENEKLGKPTNLHTIAIKPAAKRKPTEYFPEYFGSNIFELNETSTSIVTNFENSEENESTEFYENPNTSSSETTASSIVTQVPITDWNYQNPKSVNTPQPPENNSLSTKQLRSTPSSQEILLTTLEVPSSTTNLPQDIKVTRTDQLNFTQSPEQPHLTPSTIKYDEKNETSNGSFPIGVSEENFQKLNIPLNETVEKISVRVNVLTDHVLEGSQDGKLFRQITPIIGVEKKIEFNSKFKNKGLETYKKELGNNWENFMEDLIQQFFSNRTNEGPNSLESGGLNECKGKEVSTDPQLIGVISPNPPSPQLSYNKLSSMNFGTGLLTPHQEVNDPNSWLQNQGNPTHFDKYQQKLESMHTFTYPPFGKSKNFSRNSAILFKNKQPVYRLASLPKPDDATTNIVNSSLASSNTSDHLEEKQTSGLLEQIINSINRPLLIKLGERTYDGKIDLSPPNKTDQVGDVEPAFRISDWIKLEKYQKRVTPKQNREYQKPKEVEVEEGKEEISLRAFFNKLFDVFSSSSSGN